MAKIGFPYTLAICPRGLSVLHASTAIFLETIVYEISFSSPPTLFSCAMNMDYVLSKVIHIRLSGINRDVVRNFNSRVPHIKSLKILRVPGSCFLEIL